jgi:hypothetical protein
MNEMDDQNTTKTAARRFTTRGALFTAGAELTQPGIPRVLMPHLLARSLATVAYKFAANDLRKGPLTYFAKEGVL